MRSDEYDQIMREHLRESYLLSDARIDEMLPRFVSTLKKLMVDLEKQAGENDLTGLMHTGHAMKGALLNLGLQQLAQKAFRLEKLDSRPADRESAAALIADLRQEVDKLG
jgi:HPt (histidine-containing phosphotransfer) domain-containing protein